MWYLWRRRQARHAEERANEKGAQNGDAQQSPFPPSAGVPSENGAYKDEVAQLLAIEGGTCSIVGGSGSGQKFEGMHDSVDSDTGQSVVAKEGTGQGLAYSDVWRQVRYPVLPFLPSSSRIE